MNAMDLHSLQASFRRAVLEGRDEALAGRVRPAGALTGAGSLAVYRHNLRGAVTRALHDVYPVCAHLLGDARFRGIATGYIRVNPSRCADLNAYGEGFADFLSHYCDEHAGEEPRLACLPHLSRLERRYHDAYYAADDAPFDFEAFSGVPEGDRERIVLEPSRALALVSSTYPLYTTWRLRAWPDDFSGDRAESRREYLCVHRDGMRPAIERVALSTYRLLADVVQGKTLGDLSRRFDDLDRRLPPLIEKGQVASFRLADRDV